MTRFAAIVFALACLPMMAAAQTYTQHVQQQSPGMGKVTITESSHIDSLVNGLRKAPAEAAAGKSATQPERKAEKKEKPEKPARPAERESRQPQEGTRPEPAKPEPAKPEERHAQERQDEEPETPTVDMRRKVMRHARKVPGYRVQAFAGGNTRADKQKAEQIGRAIKMAYPEQPIYVHFYSPRWICRVGNFRTYGEAQQMLSKVRALGFKAATIVKGKITVND